MNKKLLIVLLLFIFSSVLFATKLQLTPNEELYLQQHPLIKVSNENDWPPFDFTQKGKASGYSVELIEELAKIIGVEVVFVNGYSWSELLEQFSDKNIDLMHTVSKNRQRQKDYSFSDAYMPFEISYFIRENEQNIHSLKDFSSHK